MAGWMGLRHAISGPCLETRSLFDAGSGVPNLGSDRPPHVQDQTRLVRLPIGEGEVVVRRETDDPHRPLIAGADDHGLRSDRQCGEIGRIETGRVNEGGKRW